MSEFRKPGDPAKRRLAIFTVIVFLGTSYIILDLFCSVASLSFFQIRSAAARLGQSGVLFSQVIDTSGAIKNGNYPLPFFVRENAEPLDRLHFLRTPLVRSREINKLRHGDSGEGMAAGWWDGLTSRDDGTRVAWGWAALSGRHRPADAVLLAYADAQSGWIGFALSNAVVNRPDVARALRSSAQLWSGWSAVFPRDAVPAGAEISAWALDAKDPKLYRLQAPHRMFNP